MSNYGEQLVTILQILQPFCVRQWGDAFGSPAGLCDAALSDDSPHKCYQSRATCPVPDVYSPGTLTLSFGFNQEGLLQYGNVFPTIEWIETTPGVINLGAMQQGVSPVGQREVVQITMSDFQWNDHLVDKYRLQRPTGEAKADGYLLHYWARTEGNAQQDITGDIDVRIKVAAESWATGTQTLASKRNGFNTDYAWHFDLSSGRPRFGWHHPIQDSNKSITSGFEVPAADGEAIWIRFTLDVEAEGSPSQHVGTFYTSSDGETWDVLDTITVSESTELDSKGSVDIYLARPGFIATSFLFRGKTYAFELRDGIDGDLVCKFDANDASDGASFVVTSDTGDLWSLGSADDGSIGRFVNWDTFDPAQRGSFWGKWLARNPYYQNYQLRIYEGILGQDLSDMRVRNYIIDKIDGPADGKVTITAKDQFAKIEARKAVAPFASRGELAGDITGSPSSFSVTPSGIGVEDYPHDAGSPSQLHVAIGNEIIRCSRNGDVFSILERGALNTEIEDHDEEDLVQLVLTYTSKRAHEIVFDLLSSYTALGREGSPSGSDYIDTDAWASAASTLTELYTGHIATPTPVYELIGELVEQAGFSIWHNVESGMIEFKALRAESSTITFNDDEHLIEDSLSIKRRPENRVSQVWVYYGQINPLEDLDDPKNYRSRLIDVDLESEADEKYGTSAIKTVFSRWIPQFGRTQAVSAAARILAMFVDPPVEAEFRVPVDYLDDVNMAGYVNLSTAEVQDSTGGLMDVQHAVFSIERLNHEARLKTQTVVFPFVDEATAERTIYIENSDYNLNLREIHDLLYEAPTQGSPQLAVRFIVERDVVIGSVSADLPAMSTGAWPVGVSLTLENLGRIQGKGGKGGSGGLFLEGLTPPKDGLPGGPGLRVEVPISIDNAGGSIWGGGGGGGGGGMFWTVFLGASGGGGGGGGAGTDGGAGGETDGFFGNSGGPGAAGTGETGGAGGQPGSPNTVPEAPGQGGAGGSGGGPGEDGQAGSPETSGIDTPGSGGAAGSYIQGISMVTWIGSPTGGDIRGNVS